MGKAQQISMTRFFIPIWPLFRWFSIGTERDTALHFGRLDEYSRSVIRELKESLATDGQPSRPGRVSWSVLEARKSFVGLFLEDAKKKGVELSEDYLRDLVLNFLIAGRDTTAQALSWALFCLCKHPEIAERARQEVETVIGDRDPCYEDVIRLPYLQAVL